MNADASQRAVVAHDRCVRPQLRSSEKSEQSGLPREPESPNARHTCRNQPQRRCRYARCPALFKCTCPTHRLLLQIPRLSTSLRVMSSTGTANFDWQSAFAARSALIKARQLGLQDVKGTFTWANFAKTVPKKTKPNDLKQGRQLFAAILKTVSQMNLLRRVSVPLLLTSSPQDRQSWLCNAH